MADVTQDYLGFGRRLSGITRRRMSSTFVNDSYNDQSTLAASMLGLSVLPHTHEETFPGMLLDNPKHDNILEMKRQQRQHMQRDGGDNSTFK